MPDISLYCQSASEIYASAIFLPVSVPRWIRSARFLRIFVRRLIIGTFKFSVSLGVERLVVVSLNQTKCRERLKFNKLQLFSHYICQSII